MEPSIMLAAGLIIGAVVGAVLTRARLTHRPTIGEQLVADHIAAVAAGRKNGGASVWH